MSVNQNSKFFARPSGDISYTPTSGGSPSISSDSEELREILTTKGDLFVYTGTAVSRQAVGADNKPLVADSAQTNGVRYGGKILVDEAEIDAALNHDGSTAGFFGVTPASRAAALTQTYSTARFQHIPQMMKARHTLGLIMRRSGLSMRRLQI